MQCNCGYLLLDSFSLCFYCNVIYRAKVHSSSRAVIKNSEEFILLFICSAHMEGASLIIAAAVCVVLGRRDTTAPCPWPWHKKGFYQMQPTGAHSVLLPEQNWCLLLLLLQQNLLTGEWVAAYPVEEIPSPLLCLGWFLLGFPSCSHFYVFHFLPVLVYNHKWRQAFITTAALNNKCLMNLLSAGRKQYCDCSFL